MNDYIIGVDEAGRGSLAGPVVAAAVILNFKDEFKDSKVLSEKRRLELREKIINHHRYGIGIASVKEIEKLNIHHASLIAMKRAVINLKVTKGHIIVDGQFTLGELEGFSQESLIKGDQKSPPCMAASIMAKTTRDAMLKDYDKTYPSYSFKDHKGYGTKKHLEAIKKYGICPIHRKTFSGVKL